MIPDHEEGIRQLKYAYDKGINVGPDQSTISFTPVPLLAYTRYIHMQHASDHAEIASF